MIKRKRHINKVTKKKKVVKKQSVKVINKKRDKDRKYLPDIIEKRYVLVGILIVILFSIISLRDLRIRS